MPALDMGIDGRPALVTGGGKGIKRATALLLAEVGTPVAIVDLDGNAARGTAEEIASRGGKAIALAANVSREDEVEAAVAEAAAALGAIRILVNNAGIGEHRPTLDLPLADWKRVIEVLTAVFHITKLVVGQMIDAGDGGAIVNLASVAGLCGVPNRSSYAAAKHGVVGLTRTLALELARHGIRKRRRRRHRRNRPHGETSQKFSNRCSLRRLSSVGPGRAGVGDCRRDRRLGLAKGKFRNRISPER